MTLIASHTAPCRASRPLLACQCRARGLGRPSVNCLSSLRRWPTLTGPVRAVDPPTKLPTLWARRVPVPTYVALQVLAGDAADRSKLRRSPRTEAAICSASALSPQLTRPTSPLLCAAGSVRSSSCSTSASRRHDRAGSHSLAFGGRRAVHRRPSRYTTTASHSRPEHAASAGAGVAQLPPPDRVLCLAASASARLPELTSRLTNSSSSVARHPPPLLHGRLTHGPPRSVTPGAVRPRRRPRVSRHPRRPRPELSAAAQPASGPPRSSSSPASAACCCQHPAALLRPRDQVGRDEGPPSYSRFASPA
jgi:hypothetical protein